MRVNDLDEIDRIIGQNIAVYRERKGFTPKQLGIMLGLSRHHIQQCERGKRPLPASRLPVVCEVLDIYLWELLGEEAP